VSDCTWKCLPADTKQLPTTIGKDSNVGNIWMLTCIKIYLQAGCSVTGILHFCNQAFVDWYSKGQACVQKATFGSELVAACIAVDKIMDFGSTLCYLDFQIKTTTCMLCDNHAVVNNSAIPNSCLSKRQLALSYHCVCEAIGAKVVNYFWIDGKNKVWHLL
jgi:hypothetical protein